MALTPIFLIAPGRVMIYASDRGWPKVLSLDVSAGWAAKKSGGIANRSVPNQFSFAALRPKLVGAGPVLEQLRQQAADLGIEDRVHFPARMKDVRRALKSFDVFVLPSIALETFSNATLEAMVMSVPVILSNIAGAPEIVTDGETGYLYEKDDLERLTDLVRNLGRDKNLRAKMGRRARESVEQRFNIKRMFDAYEGLLKGV
jgi:glycosyltransferase involved in cell wall biosynthesis